MIDAPVTVMSGTLGKMTDFTPGWVSICRLSDYGDSRLLLHRYGAAGAGQHAAEAQAQPAGAAAARTTKARFAEAGYPLRRPKRSPSPG